MKLIADLNPPRPAAPAQPCPAVEQPTDAALAAGVSKAVGETLAGLLNDESALYAITREWRYDATGRRFVRLQVLLDEQFSEIGLRLTRLAARSRDLGFSNMAGHGHRTTPPRATVTAGALQAHLIRELLGLHEAMCASLKRASVVASGCPHDRETTELLADLTASHEKDAFMLRALLWEVENVTP
jgi:starvation-inducible DNA-binding protein